MPFLKRSSVLEGLNVAPNDRQDARMPWVLDFISDQSGLSTPAIVWGFMGAMWHRCSVLYVAVHFFHHLPILSDNLVIIIQIFIQMQHELAIYTQRIV